MNELDLLRQFGLLTPADEQRAREQSVYASLGGLAQALMAPRQRGQSALAQFGQAALQGYQAGEQSFDQTLQSILRRTQLQDLLRQRQEQDAARKRQALFQQRLQGTMRQVPTGESLMAAQSNIDPAMLEGMSAGQVGQQAMQQGLPTRTAFDRDAYLSALAEYAPEKFAELMMRPEEEYTLGEGQIRYRGGRPIAAGPEKAPDLTTDQKNYNAARAEGYKGTFQQFMIDQRKAGATQVSVSTDKKLGETLGAQTAQLVGTGKQQAEDALATLQTVNDIRPLLSQGVFEGRLGSAQAFVSRLGTSLGITGTDTQDVLNRTSAAMQGLASLELQAAGQLRGQGQITEGERALIARVAGGKLNELTAAEVNTLLGALEKTAKYRISKHNQSLEGLIKRNPQLGDALEFYRVPLIPANVGVEKL